jgi:integrase
MNITTKAAREKLEHRKEPYWLKLRKGCFLGYAAGPKTWHVRYRDRNGKQNWKPLGDNLDYAPAKAKAESWLDLATAGNRRAPSRGTVRAALMTYVLHLRSIGRRKTAQEARKRFALTVGRNEPLRAMKLEDVSRDDVEAWRDRLRKGRKPRSINRQVRAVVAALNFAVTQRGHVGNREAWELVHLVDDDEENTAIFLTSLQRDRLIAASPKELAALLTGYRHTGARPSELAKTTVADFNAEGGTVTLRHRKGKGAKLRSRAVMLGDDGIEFFRGQARGKLPKAPLISNLDGGHWEAEDWSVAIRAAAIVANETAKTSAQRLPAGVSAYSFRHARIAELLQVFMVDPLTVAAQCGTSLIMIEKFYYKFISGSMREKLNAVKAS